MLRWLLLTLTVSTHAWAHPVIYQDGWVASTMNMSDMTDANLTYSLTSRWALGVNYWRLKNTQGLEREWQLTKVNHLLWRHNGEDSQANLYVHSGIGRAEEGSGPGVLGWLGGAELDWETRVHFVGVKYLHLSLPTGDNPITMARVGLSPKLADFNSLQSWAMLQAWYEPWSSREVKLTPLLRFFYHNVLWEMGSSFKGEWLMTLMVHY